MDLFKGKGTPKFVVKKSFYICLYLFIIHFHVEPYYWRQPFWIFVAEASNMANLALLPRLQEARWIPTRQMDPGGLGGIRCRWLGRSSRGGAAKCTAGGRTTLWCCWVAPESPEMLKIGTHGMI